MSALVTATGLSIAGRLSPTDLTLEAGQLTCLIGPNGSGKTSLLHAIASVGPATGDVRIAGEAVAKLHPDRRQRLLAYLPASRDIKWPLKAGDLIALGLPPECDLAGIVADLEIEEWLDRRVDRLSTGERSRVLIARTLAARPRLLLLDEPVANLDPLWQLKLMDYLQALARRTAQALLVAMHDLELARLYADRLIIMNEGAVAADGNPDALLNGPHIPAIFGIEQGEMGWRPAR